MTVTNFNLETLRARTFKGFVQFEDPGTPGAFFRLKERQVMTTLLDYLLDGHYNDDGTKLLDPAGHNHRFNMNLKMTLDLADDVFSAASDQETLSYWIFQLEQKSPLIISFATIAETEGNITGDTHVQLLFNLVPSTFGPTVYGAQGGSIDMAISGEIISITSLTRESAATIQQ
ncbi:hypothetical protein LCGC14_3069580 [marine sediment metagenome]|uniref:Uncharacterized protein n=1 Tax=marine sediment metagenome TaxID=412755 RepID=A0A0F8X4W3_9ZZZZ